VDYLIVTVESAGYVVVPIVTAVNLVSPHQQHQLILLDMFLVE
jgi:hypothetical protein